VLKKKNKALFIMYHIKSTGPVTCCWCRFTSFTSPPQNCYFMGLQCSLIHSTLVSTARKYSELHEVHTSLQELCDMLHLVKNV
jgi:hypothetical protein